MQSAKSKIVILICLGLALSVAIPAAGASDVVEDTKQGASDTLNNAAPEELRALASYFTEDPGAVPIVTSGLSCGQSGHCNVMVCDIDCPAGQGKSCSCSPTEVKCTDKHNTLNPFDNDEHNMYACDCACLKDPPKPEPDCLVEVGDKCLLEEALASLVDSNIEQLAVNQE